MSVGDAPPAETKVRSSWWRKGGATPAAQHDGTNDAGAAAPNPVQGEPDEPVSGDPAPSAAAPAVEDADATEEKERRSLKKRAQSWASAKAREHLGEEAFTELVVKRGGYEGIASEVRSSFYKDNPKAALESSASKPSASCAVS